MSTYYKENVKCGLCGFKFERRKVGSTHTVSSCDLDLRPTDMLLSDYIVKCPNCGYVHSDIEKNAEQHKDLIRTRAYETCWNTNLSNGLAGDFCRYALILNSEGDRKGAFYALMCAVWACEGYYDREGATFCRNTAIELYDHKDFGNESDYALMYIDLLRRTGRFDECIEFCKSLTLKDKQKQQIVDFQIQLCKNRDTECYTVAVCDAVFIHLDDESFDLIKSGKKKMQVICNDEKYRRLKVGDKIIFCRNSNPKENIFAEITELKSFETFEALKSFHSAEPFGCDELTHDLSVFADKDYTKEAKEKHGILAISITVRHPSFYD